VCIRVCWGGWWGAAEGWIHVYIYRCMSVYEFQCFLYVLVCMCMCVCVCVWFLQLFQLEAEVSVTCRSTCTVHAFMCACARACVRAWMYANHVCVTICVWIVYVWTIRVCMVRARCCMCYKEASRCVHSVRNPRVQSLSEKLR
jgi:hypothetical protein